MATNAQSNLELHVSDAEFRAWGVKIAAGIAATGATKVTQTGQIDWTTVTRSGSADNKRGFEVYKLTGHDGLPDIFIRIDYGNNGQTAGGCGFSIWYTVGYSVNGSGVIGGNNSGEVQCKNAGGIAYDASAGWTLDQYCSGDGADRLTVVTAHAAGESNQNRGALFQVERLRDATGLVSDGVYVYGAHYIGGVGTRGRAVIVPQVGSVPSNNNTQEPALLPVARSDGRRCAHPGLKRRLHAPSARPRPPVHLVAAGLSLG